MRGGAAGRLSVRREARTLVFGGWAGRRGGAATCLVGSVGRRGDAEGSLFGSAEGAETRSNVAGTRCASTAAPLPSRSVPAARVSRAPAQLIRRRIGLAQRRHRVA